MSTYEADITLEVQALVRQAIEKREQVQSKLTALVTQREKLTKEIIDLQALIDTLDELERLTS